MSNAQARAGGISEDETSSCAQKDTVSDLSNIACRGVTSASQNLSVPFEEMPSGKPGRLSMNVSSIPSSDLQPEPPHSIFSRLRHQYKRLIRTDRDAVCEIKTFEQRSRLLCLRIEGQQAAVGLVLENVAVNCDIGYLEDASSEVDRSIRADIEVVKTAEPFPQIPWRAP